ncbi:MAG: hypothetical protein PHY93_16200 [Bacteriovorax sp.]|nr:hypothetical protein [Bacteriovorax sp.]
MLKCNEIVEIIAKNKDLSLLGKMELRFHLFMCKHCNSYSKQISIINSQFKKVIEEKSEIEMNHVHELEDQVIKVIKAKLEKKD